MSGAMPHLALIVSPLRQAAEPELIRRHAVGLVAEGATVTLFEPEPERAADEPEGSRPAAAERRFGLPRTVRYPTELPFWRRRDAVERIVAAFDRAGPDLIWCAGADAWATAIGAAERLDRPAVLDLRHHHDLHGIRRAVRSERVVAIVTPCPALRRAAVDAIGESLVRLVPLGIRIDDSERADRPGLGEPSAGRGPIVAVLGGQSRASADPAAFADALRAARAAADRDRDALFLVEFPHGASSGLWSFARSLRLLDRITALGGGRLAMTAVETCDLLLVPAREHGPRAEILAALGRGVPTVASADPFADALVDGETAVLVPSGGGAQAWTDALLALVDHPEESRRMGGAARARILRDHRSSDAVRACLDTAIDLLRGGPLRWSVGSR